MIIRPAKVINLGPSRIRRSRGLGTLRFVFPFNFPKTSQACRRVIVRVGDAWLIFASSRNPSYPVSSRGADSKLNRRKSNTISLSLHVHHVAPGPCAVCRRSTAKD